MASKRTKGVRILYVKDPYNLNSVSGIRATGRTQATFSDVADQFTNNPNPAYDPSKAPGAVREVSVASARKSANRPGKASRGHQKVHVYGSFNQNQGKKLKRVT
jgi:hypothetical protein